MKEHQTHQMFDNLVEIKATNATKPNLREAKNEIHWVREIASVMTNKKETKKIYAEMEWEDFE